jgi:hypothetical protein
MEIRILEVVGFSLGRDTGYLDLIRDFTQSLHERNWYSRLHSLSHDICSLQTFSNHQ